MSAAILLAPGDVIKRSTEELKQRQIQINLIDWPEGVREKGVEEAGREERAERAQNGEETQSTSGKEKEGGKKTQNANVDGRLHIAVGSGSSAEGFGGSPGKNADGGDGEIGRRNRITNEGDGTNGASSRGWVVLTDEIARAIESKYGTKVEVYADEPEAQIIEIERNLQKELGISREGVAEQTERLRDIRRRERHRSMKKVETKHKVKDRKKKEVEDVQKEDDQTLPTREEMQQTGVVVEGVMSQKKLLSMIGGIERRAAPIGARESAVMLVSNSLKDVARATAYFTSPTGDPNWKEVAREASKNKNILAYTSAGGDVKSEFLHLIDHL
uniref:Viral protein 6 n=1 Tax=Bluetongue virus TaxID=40051 RepID=A0A142DXV6_BTV|nr:viral protein 6 [Bluetongue virus]